MLRIFADALLLITQQTPRTGYAGARGHADIETALNRTGKRRSRIEV